MALVSVTRPHEQSDLLQGACAARRRARLVAARGMNQETIYSRFIAVHANHVLVELPSRGTGNIAPRGALLNVQFEHDNERYVFRTETQGRVDWINPRGRSTPAWRLTRPVQILLRRERQHIRVGLADIAPASGHFTSTRDPETLFRVQIQNLSTGGMNVTTDTQPPPPILPGETYWADFELPGVTGALEVVIRIVHVHRDVAHGLIKCGCTFCPTDDPAHHAEQLKRIEEFILSRERLATADALNTLQRGE